MYLFKRISSLTLGLLGADRSVFNLVKLLLQRVYFTFFCALFCIAGFGLFELGLELVGLAPLFLLLFLIIHNIP
jgi:hypothetical protein